MLGESYVALTPSSRRQQCFHSAFNKLFLSRALNVYVTFVKNNKSTRGKKEINKTRESTKALLSRKVITKIKKQTFKLLLFDSINRTYFSVPSSLFSCTKQKRGISSEKMFIGIDLNWRETRPKTMRNACFMTTILRSAEENFNTFCFYLFFFRLFISFLELTLEFDEREKLFHFCLILWFRDFSTFLTISIYI